MADEKPKAASIFDDDGPAGFAAQLLSVSVMVLFAFAIIFGAFRVLGVDSRAEASVKRCVELGVARETCLELVAEKEFGCGR